MCLLYCRFFDFKVAFNNKQQQREDQTGDLVIFEYLGLDVPGNADGTVGHEDQPEMYSFNELFKPHTVPLKSGRFLLHSQSTELTTLHFTGQNLSVVTVHRPIGSSSTDAGQANLSEQWQSIFAPGKKFVVPTDGINCSTAYPMKDRVHFNRIMLGNIGKTKQHKITAADAKRIQKTLKESLDAQKRALQLGN